MSDEIKKQPAKRGRKKKEATPPTTPVEEIAGKVEESAKETKPVDNAEFDFENMNVAEYFQFVKNMKHETESESVKTMLEVCEKILKTFEITGQKEAAKKATLTARLLKKELELYEKGIRTWVHIDDITKYYHHLKDDVKKPLKLIEISNFPRLIPEEVIDKWLEVREYFDVGYILFTDYTEETEKQDTVASTMGKSSTQKEVEKKRKEKDPILFGAIRVDTERKSMESNTYEKLYYVGDWVDEYCDLTFDKLVERLSEDGKAPHEIVPVVTKEDFKREAGL